MEKFQLDSQHPTQMVINRFSEHFTNIKVINFHGNRIDAAITCDIIATPKTCSTLMGEKIIHEFRRDRSNLVHFERIGQLAYDTFSDSRIYSSYPRRQIIGGIRYCLKRGMFCCNKCEPFTRLPTKTLNETVSKYLLEKSIQFENGLSVMIPKSGGERELRFNFEKQKGKFGSVDLAFIFSSEWKRRLRRVRPMVVF